MEQELILKESPSTIRTETPAPSVVSVVPDASGPSLRDLSL